MQLPKQNKEEEESYLLRSVTLPLSYGLVLNAKAEKPSLGSLPYINPSQTHAHTHMHTRTLDWASIALKVGR